MGLIITNSLNIAEFEFATTYDPTNHTVTITNQTSYITSAASTQGIDFTLVSPSGLEYYSNDLWNANSDITPTAPTTPFVNTNMPLFEGVLEWGLWKVTGVIKDGNGTLYSLTYTQNICRPAQCPNTSASSDGCAIISFTANCQLNKVIYSDDTIYTYQGIAYTAITYDVSMTYPISSGLSPITNANVPFFTLNTVYDGLYSFSIDNAATYYFSGTNTSIIIHYTQDESFLATCKQNLCGILCSYQAFIDKFLENQNAGTNSSRLSKYTVNNLALLNSYVNEATIKYTCGEDLSTTIEKIEALTGSTCDCSCGANNASVVDTLNNIVINSTCGDITVNTSHVGNTYTFTINDTSYNVTSASSGVTITTTDNEGTCTRTFDIGVCLQDLAICGSVFPVANGSGGTTNVASSYSNIVAAQNASIQTLYTTKVGAPTWTNVSDGEMQNSWVNLAQVSYSKDQAGFVEVRGTITKSAAGATSTWFTFPSGYRPVITETLSGTLFDTVGGYYPAQITLSAVNGDCKIVYAGTGSGTSRIGVNFRFSTT